jgi:nucleoside-diphosphate-sugar epimerase
VTVLVTGAAGFIGSNLCERLLADGHEVVGVDAYTPYYSPALKRANAAALHGRPNFTMLEADLRTTPMEPLLRGIDLIYHLAGQPGVRDSFGDKFPEYVEHNILATHRLLEAAGPGRFVVFASSSTVYGSAPRPFREDGPALPFAPYGVTKLAAERLCLGLTSQKLASAMVCRFFTVYGPRQRPDMAFTRLIRAILKDEAFPLMGTGEQTREFTEVSDICAALALAGTARRSGLLVNVAGGHTASMNHAIEVVERLAGRKARINRLPVATGDMPATEADTSRIRKELGWKPVVTLEEGLGRQLAWVRRHLELL